MANDISTGVWRIDTLPFSYQQQVKIDSLNWTDQANAGDQMIITNFAGKAVHDVKTQAANVPQTLGKLGWQNGIVVTKLDSGVILIAVGAGR